jgi:hypothetical protein
MNRGRLLSSGDGSRRLRCNRASILLGNPMANPRHFFALFGLDQLFDQTGVSGAA